MRLANQNRASEPERIAQRERRFRAWIAQSGSARTVFQRFAGALKVSQRGAKPWIEFFASGRPWSALNRSRLAQTPRIRTVVSAPSTRRFLSRHGGREER